LVYNPIMNTRIVCQFSCGAASAVAWKVAKMRYGHEAEVQAVYLASVENDEHPDNQRFLRDVEDWVGDRVLKLYHPKFRSIDDVFLTKRFIAHAQGAICTRMLKREVAEAYLRPDDRLVLGFTADEQKRIQGIVLRQPERKFLWVLAQAGVRKEDCYHALSAAGIELPAMYKMGYDHNNCVGCVKAGKGYWNKIRRDFPEVFARRAKVQRDIGPGACFRSGGTGFMLDELDPNEGRDVKEPAIECGMYCDRYADALQNWASPAKRTIPLPVLS
jgi:hypothetical protein